MLRYVNGAPASADFSTLLNIRKYVEIGGSIRTDEAYAGIFNVYLSKKFCVGYMYEMSTRAQLASALNTNEFLLRFKF